MDARWTKKNNTVFYGYKNHVKDDSKTKLIKGYTVTDASVHDCLRRYFVVTSYGTVVDRERRGTTTFMLTALIQGKIRKWFTKRKKSSTE